MKFTIIRDPVFVMIIDNFFDDDTKEAIRLEAKNQKYQEATIRRGVDKDMRSNTVSYYDAIYDGKREQSVLLSATAEKFKSQEFQEVMTSCPYPISEFNLTNFHETQVSVYKENQHYKWHIDRFDNYDRMITLVYYFFKEPQMFSGGEICLTNSPICDGEPIEKLYPGKNLINIKPKSNRAIVFSSTIPHCVMPTTALNIEDSRMSANMWIGCK